MMNDAVSLVKTSGLSLLSGAESFLSDLTESDEIAINGGDNSNSNSGRRRPRRRPRRPRRRNSSNT
ncbi:MAG: hypothetical protein MUF72_17030 [Elainella sp. Prado103]|nr:hypothetical protein [Elainella sp. Prado103]